MTTVFALAGSLLAITPSDLQSTLTSAFADEAKAEGYYQAVLLKFGARRPFSNVVRAEGAHRRLVEGLMKTHGYKVPKNPYSRWPKEPKAKFIERSHVPPTWKEALEKARDLEAGQGPFYDGMIALGVPKDVEAVFLKLKSDSLEKHQKAFERNLGAH